MKAILFDHDGTLVDSEKVHCELWIALLREHYGITMTAGDYARHHSGIPTPANAREMVRRYGLDETPEGLARRKEQAVDGFLARSAFALMPGAAETVDAFRGEGLRVGVVTGADARAVAATVRAHFRPDTFDTVAAGEMVERSKPAPDVYQLAMRKLGVEPGDCWAIEDTETGLRSATAAGVRCVVVPGPLTRHQDFSAAAHVAASLDEARGWILGG